MPGSLSEVTLYPVLEVELVPREGPLILRGGPEVMFPKPLVSILRRSF